MKIRPLAYALIFIALLTYGLHLARVNSAGVANFQTRQVQEIDPEVTVEIPTGATGSAIAKILFDAGIVKSSQAYFRTAVADIRSQKVAPGAHRLTLRISSQQALDQLLDSARLANMLTIFEGEWKSEVTSSLISYGFSKSEIKTAFSSIKLPKGFKNAEGLLFPALYSFPSGTSAKEAVGLIVARFDNEPVAQEILTANGKYSPLQLLTIASIVQSEGDNADFAKISRVIRNRLEIGMPLQMDSTVHYIKGVRGQIFLSTTSTLITSPYNTYKNYGLPPGPIGNPGALAMTAALHPAKGDWLYFITVAPGDTRFTRSDSEFVTWKFLYEKNRRAGAFK